MPATVKICSAQVAMHIYTVLFGSPAMVVVKIRPLASSLQSLNQPNEYFNDSMPNENLHRVVSPACGKTTENRDDNGRSSTAVSTASFALGPGVHRRCGMTCALNFESPTELGAVQGIGPHHNLFNQSHGLYSSIHPSIFKLVPCT